METRLAGGECVAKILCEVCEGGDIGAALNEEEVVRVGAKETIEFEELERWSRQWEDVLVSCRARIRLQVLL